MFTTGKRRGQCVFWESFTNSTTIYRQNDHIRNYWLYSGGAMSGRRAGSGVGKYNAESPKQGSKRFNSITKTIHFAHLGI